MKKLWMFAAMCFPVSTMAEPIEIEKSYAFIANPASKAGAVYFEIANVGDEDITIFAAKTKSAQMAQLHQTVTKDGISSMVHQEDGVVIPAGECVAFEPGGFHVMLMGIDEGLFEEENLQLELQFDDQDQTLLTLEVPVMHTQFPEDIDILCEKE